MKEEERNMIKREKENEKEKEEDRKFFDGRNGGGDD